MEDKQTEIEIRSRAATHIVDGVVKASRLMRSAKMENVSDELIAMLQEQIDAFRPLSWAASRQAKLGFVKLNPKPLAEGGAA